jgi:hypothetical protein
MATEAPPKPTPPTGPELKLPGSTGGANRVDPKIIEAANALAAKNAPQGEALPEPTPDPEPKPATPPAPNAAQPEPKKEPVKTEPKADDEPVGVKQTREAYERKSRKLEEVVNSLTATTQEKAAALQKLADLEAKHAKAVEEIEKDYKPRVAKLAEVEKKLVEREEMIRIKDYTATEEFHEKFTKPISDTDRELQNLLAESVVTINGETVAASREHFDAILQTKSLNAAGELAEQLFGRHVGPQMVNLRARMKSLLDQRQDAVKNAGIASQKFVEEQQIRAIQSREQFKNSVFSEANRSLSESPHLKVSDDDAEGKALIGSATQFADSLWEEPQGQTPEQVAKRLATVRHDIIEGRVVRAKYAKAVERIKELETRLSDYESSSPDMNPRGAAPAATLKPAEATKATLLAAANALAAKRGG